MIYDIVELTEPPIERGFVTRKDKRGRFYVEWLDSALGTSMVFQNEFNIVGKFTSDGKIKPSIKCNARVLRQNNIQYVKKNNVIRVDPRIVREAAKILFGGKPSSTDIMRISSIRRTGKGVVENNTRQSPVRA